MNHWIAEIVRYIYSFNKVFMWIKKERHWGSSEYIHTYIYAMDSSKNERKVQIRLPIKYTMKDLSF
jgi:hypothetical protein